MRRRTPVGPRSQSPISPVPAKRTRDLRADVLSAFAQDVRERPGRSHPRDGRDGSGQIPEPVKTLTQRARGRDPAGMEVPGSPESDGARDSGEEEREDERGRVEEQTSRARTGRGFLVEQVPPRKRGVLLVPARTRTVVHALPRAVIPVVSVASVVRAVTPTGDGPAHGET